MRRAARWPFKSTFEDVLVSRSRRHEKRIPLDEVKASLMKSGKLSRE
jgi:hypothetical protein